MITIPGTARMLLVAGRLAGFAAVALGIVLMAGQGYELLRYAFPSKNPVSGDVWVLPFVFVLRAVVAGWVAWAVARLDGRASTRVLLAAFGISFLLLYGWYFLLLGMDDVLFYWIAVGEFLYLTGGLLVGGALLLTKSRSQDARA